MKVFRSLFTGQDDCDLTLVDPDNPLESAIEIMATPKGKRPLTINQLSGGKKTLTATSLLFSFYLLKPAPFCIFDEVDAPLDDTHSDMFNTIIQKFRAESQFIIVTHYKHILANTNIIHIITMIEAGVSRVVPYLSSKELRLKVWNHIRESAHSKGIFVDLINGYSDHCHCLISLVFLKVLKVANPTILIIAIMIVMAENANIRSDAIISVL